MAFKKENWKKLNYPNSINGEIVLTENGRKLDRFIFNDSNGLRRILNVMKGYGFDAEPKTEESVKHEANKIRDELNLLGKAEW